MGFFWPSNLKPSANFGVRLGRVLHWLFLGIAATIVLVWAIDVWPDATAGPCGPFAPEDGPWSDYGGGIASGEENPYGRWRSVPDCSVANAYWAGAITGVLLAAFAASVIGRGLRYLVAGE